MEHKTLSLWKGKSFVCDWCVRTAGHGFRVFASSAWIWPSVTCRLSRNKFLQRTFIIGASAIAVQVDAWEKWVRSSYDIAHRMCNIKKDTRWPGTQK